MVSYQSSASTDLRTKVFILALNDANDPAVAANPASYYNAAATLGRLPAFTTADFSVGAEWTKFSLEL